MGLLGMDEAVYLLNINIQCFFGGNSRADVYKIVLVLEMSYVLIRINEQVIDCGTFKGQNVLLFGFRTRPPNSKIL